MSTVGAFVPHLGGSGYNCLILLPLLREFQSAAGVATRGITPISRAPPTESDGFGSGFLWRDLGNLRSFLPYNWQEYGQIQPEVVFFTDPDDARLLRTA